MTSKQSRLDRLLRRATGHNATAVKLLLARGQVLLDGAVIADGSVVVDQFARIECDGVVVQARTPRYLMLNKPAGVVSATKDRRHRTVIDLLNESQPSDLHIAGRLDFNSTGLLLLTNDGRWSRALSHPNNNVSKRYLVTLAQPVTRAMVDAFAQGIYFSYENITTLPAQLTLLGERTVEVALQEGRYHQIKRMFGRFQNEVLTIHRTAVGEIRLDKALAPGTFRALTAQEVSLCIH